MKNSSKILSKEGYEPHEPNNSYEKAVKEAIDKDTSVIHYNNNGFTRITLDGQPVKTYGGFNILKAENDHIHHKWNGIDGNVSPINRLILILHKCGVPTAKVEKAIQIYKKNPQTIILDEL